MWLFFSTRTAGTFPMNPTMFVLDSWDICKACQAPTFHKVMWYQTAGSEMISNHPDHLCDCTWISVFYFNFRSLLSACQNDVGHNTICVLVFTCGTKALFQFKIRVWPSTVQGPGCVFAPHVFTTDVSGSIPKIISRASSEQAVPTPVL